MILTLKELHAIDEALFYQYADEQDSLANFYGEESREDMDEKDQELYDRIEGLRDRIAREIIRRGNSGLSPHDLDTIRRDSGC